MAAPPEASVSPSATGRQWERRLPRSRSSWGTLKLIFMSHAFPPKSRSPLCASSRSPPRHDHSRDRSPACLPGRVCLPTAEHRASADSCEDTCRVRTSSGMSAAALAQARPHPRPDALAVGRPTGLVLGSLRPGFVSWVKVSGHSQGPGGPASCSL